MILFKTDGSLCVHADKGYKPLNDNSTKARKARFLYEILVASWGRVAGHMGIGVVARLTQANLTGRLTDGVSILVSVSADLRP